MVGEERPAWPQEEFLAALRALAPDLCVTAAYGNMLPQVSAPSWLRRSCHAHPLAEAAA